MMRQAEELLREYVEQSKRILGDSLTGIYLHGSAVMGCFNPDTSDLDLIVVVRSPLTDSVKRRYMDMVVACNALGPAKGLEMSVVVRDVCSPFVYPTPFELHFSVMHLAWYRDDPDGYIRGMKGADPDLAAHFTIIRHRGRCLYGAPIEEVFAKVPERDYMDSIWNDVASATEEIAVNPVYLSLNLARVLAYKEDGAVLSKKEGGEWAVQNMPAEYHPLIMGALRAYTQNASVTFDAALAERYARYALRRIQQKTDDNDRGE